MARKLADVYLMRSRSDVSVNRTLEGAQEAAQRFHRARVGYEHRLDWTTDQHVVKLLAEDLGFEYEIKLVESATSVVSGPHSGIGRRNIVQSKVGTTVCGAVLRFPDQTALGQPMASRCRTARVDRRARCRSAC